MRTPDGEEELAPGDVLCFLPGPSGAHKLTNRADEPARILMFSEVKHPAVTVYPDSDKLGVFTGGDRSDDVIVKRSSGVEYFEGEKRRTCQTSASGGASRKKSSQATPGVV